MPRPAIPGIGGSSGRAISPAKKALSQRVQGERHSLSCEDPGPRKAKFEITRGLKGKSLAVNHGLRMEGMHESFRVTPLGPLMNCCRFNCPRKNSSRMGPSQPRIQGNLKGVTRLMRNMFSGTALSLKISGPPSPGPHHRL